MRAQLDRIVVILVCLVFGVVGVSSPSAAADKKKAWPTKSHHKTRHRISKPAKSAGASRSGGAAPAEDAAEDDEADESAEDDDTTSESKKNEAKRSEPKKELAKGRGKAKAKAKPAEEEDDDEREASDERRGDDDSDGDAPVVRRKARHARAAAGGAVAVELSAGPRAVHRSFTFNDPLSNYVPTAAKPYSYVLPAGPVPFVELGFYPGAFGATGLAANLGLVARYEKLLSTTTAGAGPTASTFGQQLEVGARGRIPLGDHELGLGAAYGKQAFHVNETDPGPAGGSQIPNVDYSFVALGADARVRLAPIELGAHVGTRLVYNTGSLAKNWFPTTKTTALEAGVSIAYSVSSFFQVVAGADLLRYGFAFNPVPPRNAIVAGGAIDQYISGFLALRVSISGG